MKLDFIKLIVDEIISVITYSFLFSILWDWFAIPFFHSHTISGSTVAWATMGIIFLIGFISIHFISFHAKIKNQFDMIEDIKWKLATNQLKRIFDLILIPISIVVVVVGWVVRGFL